MGKPAILTKRMSEALTRRTRYAAFVKPRPTTA
jgi:hypothetical protein